MLKIFLIIIILLPNLAQAKDLAVMLCMSSEEEGNKIFNDHLKDLGFNRFYKYQDINRDYHLSLGYIDDVEDYDVEDIRKYITNALKESLPKIVPFEFAVTSLLGRDIPYIVALPQHAQQFAIYNKALNEALIKYKHAKYKLKKFSRPENFIPHITLNAKLHREVKIDELEKVMTNLNKNMIGVQFNLGNLVIN
jgi:hypothetical protein